MAHWKQVIGGLVGILCLSTLSVSLQQKLHFDNEHWLPESHPIQAQFTEVKNEFESNNDIILCIRLTESLFESSTISKLSALTRELESIPDVEQIKSPLEATLVHKIQDSLYTETYQEALDNHRITVTEFKNHFLTSDYFGHYLSKAQDIVVLILKVDAESDGQNYSRKETIVQSVNAIIKGYPEFKDHFFSGHAYLTYHMDNATRQNLKTLLPVILFMIVLFLRLFLKSWIKTMVIGLTLLVGLIQTQCWLILLGFPLTIINITLPILITVIAIADSIHILNRWEVLAPRYSAPKDCAREVLRQTWLPCWVTTITTGVGFGCFYFSDMIPLRQFGIAAFFVIITAYVLIVSTTLGCLYVLNSTINTNKPLPQEEDQEEDQERAPYWMADRLHQLSRAYPKQIVGIGCVMAGLIGLGLVISETETSFINVFYKKTSPIQQDFRVVDKQLSGSGSIDILLKGDPELFKQISQFELTQDLNQRLLQIPRILHSQSYLNPVAMVHRVFQGSSERYPKSEEALAQELMFLEFSRSDEKNDVLSPYMDFDYATNRFHLQTKNLSSKETGAVLKEIQAVLASLSIKDAIITGQHMIFYSLSESVLKTQWVTITLTLGLVWCVFMGLFGVRLGSIGMLPNILPMLITLGSISFLKIPFDFATVLIASIALGLCVDDSIHFLHQYQVATQKGDKEPIKTTLYQLEKPLLITSLLLGLGFGIFCVSELVILIKLGVFTMLTIIMAYITDMLLLPAALYLWCRK